MKEGQPVSFSVGGYDCRIYYRGERGCPCEYFFEYKKDGKVWQNFYKYDPLHRLLCDAADLLEDRDDHTYTVFVRASEETIEENPIYRAALAQGDLLFAKLLKLHYGIADNAECSALRERLGFRILPALSEEFDRNCAVDADTVDIKLLSDSGYRILHRPCFAMKGCTHEKWEINPHRKSGVDAAPTGTPSISFGAFLRFFEGKTESAGTASRDRFRDLTVENLQGITKGIERRGYAILEPSEDRYRQLRSDLARKGYSYLPVFLFQGDAAPASAPSGRFLVAFPYDCRCRRYADPDAFARDMTALCVKGSENGAAPSPVRVADAPEALYAAILARCGGIAPKGTVCRIRTPPSSMPVGHSRWAAGDLNHVYKETKSALKRRK